jgi:hypothetical protein
VPGYKGSWLPDLQKMAEENKQSPENAPRLYLHWRVKPQVVILETTSDDPQTLATMQLALGPFPYRSFDQLLCGRKNPYEGVIAAGGISDAAAYDDQALERIGF